MKIKMRNVNGNVSNHVPMVKRCMAFLLGLVLVLGLLQGMSLTAYAGDYAHFQPQIGDVTLHDDDQSVQSITVKWQWPYGQGNNGVVITAKPIYRDPGEQYVERYGSKSSTLQASEQNIEWETSGSKDSTRSNIIRDMNLISVSGSDANPYKGSYTFEFEKDELSIDSDTILYFYLWTYTSGGGYYPDFQLAMLNIKERKVYYGQEETLDSDGNVIWTQVKFRTRFKPAENLTYTGNAQNLVTPSPATAEGVTPLYAITDTTVTTAPDDTSDLWQNSSAKTDADTYRVWYKTIVTDTADYKASEPAYSDVTINRVDSVAATVTANNRTYNGKKKALVTVDKSTLVGGTMMYALGTDDITAPALDSDSATETESLWSDTVPKGTKSGKYYVWYMVAGDKNHYDTTPLCVTVKIKKNSSADSDDETAGGETTDNGSADNGASEDSSAGSNTSAAGSGNGTAVTAPKTGDVSGTGSFGTVLAFSLAGFVLFAYCGVRALKNKED